MNGRECGSEVVQFAIAAPLLLFILFSVMQLAGMMLTTSQISSEVTHACRQLDAAGLRQAVDKEAFVKAEILGASTQLIPDNLHVERVVMNDGYERRETSSVGRETIEQRTSSMTLSYDLRYAVPSILDVAGLADQSLVRHVTCVYVGGRAIEVSMKETS